MTHFEQRDQYGLGSMTRRAADFLEDISSSLLNGNLPGSVKLCHCFPGRNP
jgi:hypothetical protein